jgi:predicted nucleic acid-binding protein
LDHGRVLAHPFVIGELALGNLGRRSTILDDLGQLPSAVVADPREVLGFIESAALMGRGMGYVDVHLLASARLTAGARIWTFDKRLADAAEGLGLGGRVAGQR